MGITSVKCDNCDYKKEVGKAPWVSGWQVVPYEPKFDIAIGSVDAA
jgi:hypothetical protein